MFPVTSWVAATCGIMLVALSLNVIRLRWAHRVLIGNNNNETILRANRAQANFLEYVPMALIMMGLLEARGTDHDALNMLGIVLLIARASHAYSILFHETWQSDAQLLKRIPFRSLGMIGTFYVLFTEIHWLLV
jgi:uncharacterized membrane protein YecN with MAPEG domain